MNTYLKDLRWGLFNLIEGDMISNIASYYGEWSDVEVTLFKEILTPDSNVVEVGSNIGMHAVPLAKFIPQGRLICFEPQRIIFQQLCCNLALNNLTNVETYRMGVSNSQGKQWIESSDYSESWNYGSFSLDKGFSTEGEFEGKVSQDEIEIVNLDHFSPVQRLNRLDLLKIDAEGFDIAVLEGARKTIAHFNPYIFIEIHADSFENTLKAIEKLGYQAYWFASRRYQADNYFQVEPFEQGYDLNLFCIPTQAYQIEKIERLTQILLKAESIEQLTSGKVPPMTKG